VAAEIINLSDYRIHPADDYEIDLLTAVDAAARDLREVLTCWGSESARLRAQECELMLRAAYLQALEGRSD
jgi:hypothetical protein